MTTGKKDVIFEPHYDGVEFLDRDGHIYNEKLLIPCGQCIHCRLKRSQDWATRCMVEANQYKYNWFLTLTYDDLHLPYNTMPIVNTDSGEVFEVNANLPTLYPKHLTKFVKDLRRRFEYHYNHTGLRFFSCGEYGEKSARPHYHMILFNIPEEAHNKLEFWKSTGSDSSLFTSPDIDQCWTYGISGVGFVTYQSAAYCARYVMKKQTGVGSSVYSDLCIEPEFCNMSRKPGIGRAEFDRNKQRIYEFDELYVPYNDTARAVPPPHYYDRLYGLEEPEMMSAIKEHRKELAMIHRDSMISQTSLSPIDFDAMMMYNKQEQVKKLVRPL